MLWGPSSAHKPLNTVEGKPGSLRSCGLPAVAGYIRLEEIMAESPKDALPVTATRPLKGS